MKPMDAKALIAAAMLLVSLLVLAACAKSETSGSAARLDEYCAAIIRMGMDGHYLLNRSMITKENAERLNLCLEALGTTNVRILDAFSGIPAAENHT